MCAYADSILLLSDGIVHDAAAVLELARAASIEAGAPPSACMPPVHCVGFFANDRGTQGPAFLETLAKKTGGTFQEFNPSSTHVYAEGELRPFNPKSEAAEDRAERLWVEARLRSERSMAVHTGASPTHPVNLCTLKPMISVVEVRCEASLMESEVQADISFEVQADSKTWTQRSAECAQHGTWSGYYLLKHGIQVVQNTKRSAWQSQSVIHQRCGP